MTLMKNLTNTQHEIIEGLPEILEANYVGLLAAYKKHKEFIDEVFEGIIRKARSGNFSYDFEMAYTDEKNMESCIHAFRNILARLGYYCSNYNQEGKAKFHVSWTSRDLLDNGG